MGRKGLLIDYEYCCGCHTCEVACQKEHGYAPGEWGIHVWAEGPWKYADGTKVQYECVPFPTDLCDLCEERVAAGKLPTCVHHCQTSCMTYGTVAELTELLEAKPKQVLFVQH